MNSNGGCAHWRIGAIALAACLLLTAPAAARRLSLVLPLKVDGAGLQRLADEVSDPASPLYGRYESIETLARRFGAPPGTRRRVAGYLRRHGATGVSIDTTGLFANATLRARTAERIFSTRLRRVRADDGRRYNAPAGRPRIPDALRGAITAVLGLDQAPVVEGIHAPPQSGPPWGPLTASAARASSAMKRTGTPAGCPAGVGSGGFTPNQYLSAFDYSPLQGAGDEGQGQRVALLEADGVDTASVDAFAQCFGLPVPPIDVFGVGLRHALAPGAETTLDLEVLDAAAPQLSAIDVYEAGHTDAAFFKALAAPLHNRSQRPQVISISLGDCEDNVAKEISRGGFSHAELALAEDVSAGITVVAATGDTGSTACQAAANKPPEHRRAVTFPASSPYVVAVGGTSIALTPSNQIAREVVWNDAPVSPGAGGGGCSEIFAGTSYQDRFLPPRVPGCFVRRRQHGREVALPLRAMPDVSLLADGCPGYAVYCSDAACGSGSPWHQVGGTSASAPLLAGGLALVDQVLRSSDRSSLGEAGFLIYWLAHRSRDRAYLFHDVTSGDNDLGPFIPGGGGRGVGCCSARPGYDLASGLGSIELAHFASVVSEALPSVHLRVSISVPPHQDPMKSGHLSWNVSCSSACTIDPGVEISVAHRVVLTSSGRPAYERSAARVEFGYRLSSRTRSAIHYELRHHRHVVITVLGAVFSPRYTVRAVIPYKRVSRRLRIGG